MDSLHVSFSEPPHPPVHTLCMAQKGKNLPDEVALECGRRLAECRNAKGMTQADLSKATSYRDRKSGLSPSRIGNFEQGTRRIRLEEAEILARVFTNYPAAYFMGAVSKRESKMLIALRTEDNPVPKAG